MESLYGEALVDLLSFGLSKLRHVVRFPKVSVENVATENEKLRL